MLEFSRDFFQPEEREGFLVDATMKTVWAAELEVLQEIAVICDRHALTWYAGYGTLLGAVRHEGYVPWDDDLDIWMVRDDYSKLMEVLQEELPEEYYVKSCLLEHEYETYPTYVANATTISTDAERLQRFHGCPFMVGVDIFPLDYLPRDEERRTYVRNMFRLTAQVSALLKNAGQGWKGKQQINNALTVLEQHYKCHIDRKQAEDAPISLLSFLWRKANELAEAYGEQDSDELVMYLNYMQSGGMVLKRQWFEELVALPFEEVMVPAPREYDAVLRSIYGDYTVRRRNLAMHDYPCYKKQLEHLRETLETMEEKYKLLEEKINQLKQEGKGSKTGQST